MNPSLRFSQFPYLIFGVSVLLLPLASQAAVPQVLNHQGRLAVNGVNFDGSGQFKFALVNSSGSVTYWSNDGTSSAGSQPTAAVTLAVSRGLYAALLGDTTLPNMTAVPTSVFENADVRLRVWFNDGSNGFQLLTPDQRLAASPYALTADKANSATSATGFSGSLAGEVSGPQGATVIAAAAVTGKLLTGFASGAGTLSGTDTLLSAINKLDANVGLRAPLASPTFTGTTSGSFSGPLSGNATTATSATSFTGSLAGDVTGTQGATAISAATVTGKALTGFASTTGPLSATDTVQSAINKLNGNNGLKANLASPAFTGTVSGITATMVGLANVDNTSDAGKPVSAAQQTALNLKANLASPTFTGTVSLPAGGTSAAPLRLATGTNLTAAVFGSIEFDGTNLYLTNNSATPTRKTIAYTDSPIASAAVGSSQLASGLTLGGTTTGTFSGPLTGNATTATSATSFTGSLAGDVTGTQGATSISAATVTGKALTGFVSGAGTLSSTDTLLSAINKLDANVGLRAPLASPNFTGTVSGISAAMVGLGNASNTSDANKPVSTAQQTALDLKAPLANPTFTGTTTGSFSGPLSGNATTATSAGSATNFTGSLAGEVTGTQGATSISAATVTGKALTGFVSGAGTLSAADTVLSAINKLNGNDGLKANLASPAFTGTVSGITATMVGLANVDNTSDAGKPVSTAQQTALNLKANLASPTFTGTVTLPAGGTSAAPLRLATGTNLTAAVFGSIEFDGTNLYLTNNSATPTRKTIAYTDSAIASAAVGSSQLAPGLTLGGTTTGTFSGPLTGNATTATSSTSFTGSLAGEVTGTQSATSISAATVTGKALTGFVSGAGTISAADTVLSAINKLNGNDVLKAPLASPTFTGTVSGISASMVGLGNVGNTSDANKPVSTAQQTALDLKAPIANPTFTGTSSGSFSGPLSGNATTATSATSFTGSLAGEVMGTQGATSIAAATVTGKALTGFVSGAGTISAADTVLSAINKLNGNDGLKANLASPTFTGTVSGITATMVGLANVDNTSDAGKPVSAAQQTALNLKANLASPTFTGTVSGITPSMVGLANVTNTSDSAKPVSTSQQAALDLKSNLVSPTFSGTVSLAAGTALSAPLKLAAGTSLSSVSFGAVEFDGANLYLTTNSASPTRKTLAFTDSVPPLVPMTSLTAAPIVPVLAWGNNGNGQTSLPALANVAAVAAGQSHSLVLLDAGTVVARGLNTSGQVTVPAGLTGVTEIAAGTAHNLVRKSDGTLVAWGDNAYGQTTLPGGITTATRVAAGEKHSLALLANGSVRAWGDNSFGQTTLPASLTGATITAIAAGSDHSLALKSDGTVIAWGRDDAAQVTLPSGLVNVVAIAAGAYHSLALKSDGTVIAWGWDGGGQVTIPAGLSGISKIAGGYAFSMALKTDGTVVLWGDNSDNQTKVPAAATQVTHIAAGASHALALRADAIAAQVARLDQDNVFTGKLGIKRTPEVNSLEVEGAASKTTAGSWLSNSDRRIKTEIQSITGALEKLEQVHLVDFRYTDEYRAAHPSIDDVRYPNVIAQEFAEVFPADVKSSGELMADGSPILQVDTYPLIIYSAAAVQELHRENQSLKKRLADQEQRLRKLEALLGN